VKEIQIPAGETRDVWWGINVSGHVAYSIRSRDGSNTVKFWWIKWGVGSIESVGEKSNDGVLPIPIRWYFGIVSAKLRAFAKADTVVRVQENSVPDKGFTFKWG
jgi:hypothetical protein